MVIPTFTSLRFVHAGYPTLYLTGESRNAKLTAISVLAFSVAVCSNPSIVRVKSDQIAAAAAIRTVYVPRI